MNIGLALELSEDVGHFSEILTDMDSRLTRHFIDKDFGQGINNIDIGIILVDPRALKFHPDRGVSYKKSYRFKNIITGSTEEISNVLSFDVILDHSHAKLIGSKEFLRYVSSKIVESSRSISMHCKKYPDFDCGLFLDELRNFFKQYERSKRVEVINQEAKRRRQ